MAINKITIQIETNGSAFDDLYTELLNITDKIQKDLRDGFYKKSYPDTNGNYICKIESE